MEIENGGAVEGFSLSSEEVSKLEDTQFVVVALPYYKEMKSLDNPEKTKRKLIVPVEMKINGMKADWIANKTSQAVIISTRGRKLADWVGFKGQFILKNQVVGKEEKLVIYLKK